MHQSAVAEGAVRADAPARRRTLMAASGAHALHDGYTDLLYVLLPIWQTQFGLGYAEIGMLRALYTGAMAGCQVPAGLLAERIGGKAVLVGGTALAALGFAAAGASGGLVGLAAALILAGIGGSVQHPVASSVVARAYEAGGSRVALGTYNFAGDLGKMAFPAATAALLTVLAWPSSLYVLAVVGVAAAALIAVALPAAATASASLAPAAPPASEAHPAATGAARRGFQTLFAIAVIDSATRMGFLTFLPFLLTAQGAGLPLVGLALALVFAGGAAGKLVCGYLGERFGVLRTVWATEGLTAAGILALPWLPLEAAVAALPLVGVALNGTSSVLYGTVPELVRPERRERAFAVFYTGSIGAGAAAPVVYGVFSDALGVPAMMALIAGVALLTLPLAWLLRPALAR